MTSSRSQIARITRVPGVDMVRLRVAVDRPRYWERKVPLGESVCYIRAARGFTAVEFNPSRFVDPYGDGLATVEEALDIAPRVWRTLCSVLGDTFDAAPDLSAAHVTRLDLTRNFFGAMEPSRLIVGLERVPRPKQGDPEVHLNAKDNRVQSLRVGSQAKRVILYNKSAESASAVTNATIRWEAQLRPPALMDSYSICSFSDITPDRVIAAAQERWEWSSMYLPVHSQVHLRGVVDAHGQKEGWSESKRAKLYWDLQDFAATGARPGSYHARQTLSALIRDHGSFVNDIVGIPLTEQLDWESGTVISVPGGPDVGVAT